MGLAAERDFPLTNSTFPALLSCFYSRLHLFTIRTIQWNSAFDRKTSLADLLFPMGVHGLSTYLRENKRLLFAQLRFEASDEKPTNLVVDAWS